MYEYMYMRARARACVCVCVYVNYTFFRYTTSHGLCCIYLSLPGTLRSLYSRPNAHTFDERISYTFSAHSVTDNKQIIIDTTGFTCYAVVVMLWRFIPEVKYNIQV